MVAFFALALLAQALPSEPDSSPPREVRLARPVVEVPLLRVTGRPAVEVLVDGQGPFRFGIETGARFVALAPRVAEKLGLAGEVFRLREIVIGGATFVDLPAARARFADDRIDGILGLPLYQDLLLTLDFPAAKVRFEHGFLAPADGLPLTRAGPFWAVPVDVGGKKLRAILDTRGSGTLGVTPTVAEQLSFAAPPVVVGTARGAAIAEVPVRMGRLAGDLRVGALTFARPLVAIRPLPAHFPEEPLLGIEALEQMVVTLDQKSALVRLSRPAGATIPPSPPLRSAGFRLRKDPSGTARIGELRPGSPAASVLREGDVVVSVAGKPPGDPEALRNLDKVPVVVERDGKRLEVEVPQIVLVP